MKVWIDSFSRLLALLACAIALGGCSLLRLGYGQLDTIAAWMADDYFDLEPQQRDEFFKRFGRLHAWHRYEQLPDYAAFLKEIQSRVQKGVGRDDVIWATDGIFARYRTLAQRGADDAAALLTTLTPQQIETLRKKWEKDNRRFFREHKLDGTPAERQKARVTRAVKQVTEWTGRLTPEQEEQVAALVAAVPAIEQMRYEDRHRRQREFLALLEQRGDSAAFAAKLRHWLTNWEEGRAPQYARIQAEWLEKRAVYFVGVERMLTPQQRATLAQRLQRYIDDFTQLAGSGQPARTAAK
jgi:hypothetical protein